MFIFSIRTAKAKYKHIELENLVSFYYLLVVSTSHVLLVKLVSRILHEELGPGNVLLTAFSLMQMEMLAMCFTQVILNAMLLRFCVVEGGFASAIFIKKNNSVSE
jgi:hypothetical protein